MNISRVLGHLQDIHDAPDDGRDFVAFEKRPEMLAAGVPPEAFDRFDFGSKPAVAREIGVLSNGEPITPLGPKAPVQRLMVESNPQGFVAAGDIAATALSDYEQLPQDFMDHYMKHLSYSRGATRASAPDPELASSIIALSRTERGRQFLAYIRDNKLTQTFLKDDEDEAPARAVGNEMFYNPAAGAAYRSGPGISGDEHETANLTVQLAHEFPHLPFGKAALGLPPRSREPTSAAGPQTVIAPKLANQRAEEFQAIREGENPVRKALGLPLRRSWLQPDDYFRSEYSK